jgi:hypothetical protein
MNKLLIGTIAVLIVVGGWWYFHQPQQQTKAVEKISWHVEEANPEIVDTDDNRKYEQAIFIDVTFTDRSTKRYDIGNAYGCAETDVGQSPELGRMNCYFALSATAFVAYSQDGKFIVERQNESAKDGSVQKTVVLEI